MSALTFASYRKNYEAIFTQDAFADLEALLQPGDCLLIDANVRRIYAQRLDPLLAEHHLIEINPAETSKSFDGVRPILGELIANGFKKNNRLVAMGGGVTQDVTAFIASILFRGVSWFFFPTNLLSQCDSCIGSKSSINFAEFKNQLGGFYPPDAIFIDISFLETLCEDEIRSGLGEMCHYFVIEGEEAFRQFETDFDEALLGGPILLDLIRKSLSIKKRLIEIDEFDEGPRRVFNYGHSFGHALEGCFRYEIPHGIAVAYGMDMANALSVELGLQTEDTRERIRASLQKTWNDRPFPKIDLDEFLAFLRKDKKNTDSKTFLILAEGLGEVFVREVATDELLTQVLTNCFERFAHETNLDP